MTDQPITDVNLEFMEAPGAAETDAAPGLGFFGLSLSSIVLLTGVIAVAGVFGFALLQRHETQPTSGPAPDFSTPLFNTDGESFTLSEHKGEIIVVNFWASWCGPCREEAPVLQATWERFRDRGVVLVGVAYEDNERDSLAFIEEFGITYPNGPDVRSRISRAYSIVGVPETFIIDRDGNIAEFIYAQVTEAGLSASLERLLVEA